MTTPLDDFLSDKIYINKFVKDTFITKEEEDFFQDGDIAFLPPVKSQNIFTTGKDYKQIDSIFSAFDQFVQANTEEEIVNSNTDNSNDLPHKTHKKYNEENLGKWVELHHPTLIRGEDESEEASVFRPSLLSDSAIKGGETKEVRFPDTKQIKQSLSTETLILSIHSLEGYNFSSEYTLIYGGVFSSKRVYDNTTAVLQKALQAADQTLSADVRRLLASYLLDQVAWENECKESLFSQLLHHCFPLVEQIGSVRNIDVSHAHLYIGKEERSGELVAHLRFEDDVILIDQKSKKAEGDNLLKRVTYHTIPLTSERAEDFFNKKEKLLRKQEMVRSQRKGSRSKTMDALLSEFLQQSADRCRIYVINSALLVAASELLERVNGSSEGIGGDREEDLMVLDAKAPRVFTSETSFCSEVVVWGHDSDFSLGVGRRIKRQTTEEEEEEEDEEGVEGGKRFSFEEELYTPRPLPLSRNITIERVRMIACSPRHTLLLTHYGSLYATGENSEGALGLGDNLSRTSFTLVDYLSSAVGGSATRGKLVFIAAGAGSLGSHSMAIDNKGQLYGWGFNKAVGTGSVQPVTRPTKITIRKLSSDPLQDEEDSKEEKIRSVSCGDGFTVCVTTSGLVYTWGQWSHGRLGLGPIPQAKTTTARRSLAARYSDQGTKKLLKYQLRPARVLGLDDVIQVACGEAHVIALLRDNSVVAWGQNTLGQLGTGPTRSGLLKDSFTPVLIAPFVSRQRRQRGRRGEKLLMKEANRVYSDVIRGEQSSVVVKNIYCGAFHSLCTDVDGGVWSWGSRGSPCLGHADTALLGEWTTKITALFSISASEPEKMVPYELLDWCLTWSMPRKIVALNDVDIVHVSAGDLHSAFLSSTGRIYLTGSGPAVPPFCPPNRITDADDIDDTEEADEKKKEESSKDVSYSKVVNDVVSSPRAPSASWLKELCTRNVRYLTSGGCRMFVIVDEELISPRLTNPLYQRLVRGGGGREEEEEEDDRNDVMSIDSRYSDFTSSQFSSILDARGKADCMVIASGHIFLCHKALLALRSPELRNMIIMEAPIEVEAGSGSDGATSSSTSLVQILLPELNRDAARALFFFLYRDSLPVWAIGSLPTLTSLSRIGKTLRIPRLFLLCERFIDILAFNNAQLDKEENEVEAETANTSSDEKVVEEMPPPTLVRDLGNLLGDPEFADVRFIAEGRAVAAHRFVLEGRCEYFRAMFRSGMAESFLPGRAVTDVVVPDSFVGFLRLLIFIYTNTLPDGSDGALIEDLMAADRYGIGEMKEVVESMLKPSLFNWVDLLRASELLSLPKLKTSVLCFLRDNFYALQLEKLSQQLEMDIPTTNTDDDDSIVRQHQVVFRQLKEEFPSLLEEIIRLRSFYSPLPPSQLLIEEGKMTKENSFLDEDKHPFPIWALALGAVSLFFYQHATQILPVGPIIPIVNVGGLVLLLLYGFRIMNR